jgi:hypothetical protein
LDLFTIQLSKESRLSAVYIANSLRDIAQDRKPTPVKVEPVPKPKSVQVQVKKPVTPKQAVATTTSRPVKENSLLKKLSTAAAPKRATTEESTKVTSLLGKRGAETRPPVDAQTEEEKPEKKKRLTRTGSKQERMEDANPAETLSSSLLEFSESEEADSQDSLLAYQRDSEEEESQEEKPLLVTHSPLKESPRAFDRFLVSSQSTKTRQTTTTEKEEKGYLGKSSNPSL